MLNHISKPHFTEILVLKTFSDLKLLVIIGKRKYGQTDRLCYPVCICINQACNLHNDSLAGLYNPKYTCYVAMVTMVIKVH